ncbi:MAG: type I-A CRISPR-associated protein Cas4/Csa1 [Aeropyrum sp.]|nr:type I-A CRISPR-associated protein Cas4/Csa1 [Aeropyrum sp.]MCE4615466.1 type I-A CRISPR-associated protein Cas4/Csa1 [Aeropyrum sp.]
MLRGLMRGSFRRLHEIAYSNPVSPELRGWRWESPPVKPRAYLGLGVSEVAYRYCPTFRDLWLRRQGVRGEASGRVEAGVWVHEAFHRAARDLRMLLSRGLPPWRAVLVLAGRRAEELPREVRELYRYLVVMWAGESASALMTGGEGLSWLPWLSEYTVDGSLLGLSRRLRVDALGEGGAVVEVKYGRSLWRHRVGLAGYALALESQLEVPVDFGVIVRVEDLGGGGRPPRLSIEQVYIDDQLREEFLEARDEAIEVLLSGSDPGLPSSCPRGCVFYRACHGGGDGG